MWHVMRRLCEGCWFVFFFLHARGRRWWGTSGADPESFKLPRLGSYGGPLHTLVRVALQALSFRVTHITLDLLPLDTALPSSLIIRLYRDPHHRDRALGWYVKHWMTRHDVQRAPRCEGGLRTNPSAKLEALGISATCTPSPPAPCCNTTHQLSKPEGTSQLHVAIEPQCPTQLHPLPAENKHLQIQHTGFCPWQTH